MDNLSHSCHTPAVPCTYSSSPRPKETTLETSPTPGSPRRRRAGRRTRHSAEVWTVESYAAQVLRVAARLAAKTHRSHDAQDIAARVAERFCKDAQANMARYETPDKYASVIVRGEAIDFGRRERVQRGQGVDGGHDVASFDAMVEASGERASATDDPIGEAVAAAEVDRLLAGLDDRDRRIAEAYWLRGDKVGEIAADLNCNHATVSRRLKAIEAHLRQAAGDDGYILAT